MALKAEPPHRKDRAARDPAAGAARVEVRKPAGVRAKAEAPDRAEAGGLNQLTNRPFNQSLISETEGR